VSIDELKKKFDSSRWQHFLADFFGDNYMMWHDGYDPNSVLNLTAEEKQVAEEMLIQSIPLNGMWSAAGLALLHSQKGVLVIKDHFPRAGADVVKIRLADAIEQITHSGEFLPVLIDILLHSGYWGDRSEVARELRKHPTKAVIESLFAAVADEDYLVRYHACDSLLAIHGFHKEIDEFHEIFVNILEEKKKKDYEIAQQQLKELFQKQGKC
jgi:hypothetical protein